MRKGHHATKKHAGGHKHHGTGKHHPGHVSHHNTGHHGGHSAHHHTHAHVVGTHHKHTKPHKFSPGLDVASCAVDALAANLRMAGREVTDADVLDLYWRLTDDPDRGVTLPEAFEAAATYGLAGAYLLDARPTAALADGVVLGVDLAERHALVADGHGVWSWGQWFSASCGLLAAADEAWELTWL